MGQKWVKIYRFSCVQRHNFRSDSLWNLQVFILYVLNFTLFYRIFVCLILLIKANLKWCIHLSRRQNRSTEGCSKLKRSVHMTRQNRESTKGYSRWKVQERMVSTLEQMQVPNGTGPGVRRSKRPLLASRTRCKKKKKKKSFFGFDTIKEIFRKMRPKRHTRVILDCFLWKKTA